MIDADGLHEWRQAAYQATRERDQARRKLARIEQMAAAWLDRFPDTIRTAAVVEAIRTVTQERPITDGPCDHRDPKRLGAQPGDLSLWCACGTRVFPGPRDAVNSDEPA